MAVMTPPNETPRSDPLSETWPEDIDARVTSIEARVRVVAAGHAHLADQIAEIAVSQHRAEQHRRIQDQKLEALQAAMAANTELTSKTLAAVQTVSDVMTTARTGGRFFRWLAPTLIAVGLAVGTVKGWWLAGLDWLPHNPPDK